MAVILVSAGAGAGASIVTAYATYRMTARQDHRKWRAELAEKYALLAADQPRAAAKTDCPPGCDPFRPHQLAVLNPCVLALSA